MADQVLALITEVCRKAAAGDLEARLPSIGESAEAVAARDAINNLLDTSDAFLRESSAASAAAAQGRFHRRILTRGLRGAFRTAAEEISASTLAMSANAARVAEAAAARLALADDLESAVLSVSCVALVATERRGQCEGSRKLSPSRSQRSTL